MSLKEFETILKKINNYTDYIYLHVQGEPFLHSNLDGILSLCSKYKKKVNITTNGILLKQNVNVINKYNCIRQINISLHSENNKRTYFEDIFNAVSIINNNIYISYRIWIKDNEDIIIDKLVNEYGKNVLKIKNNDNVKISDNIYLNKEEEFNWPSLTSLYYNKYGTCLGLKNHIGILSDGTVTICCLDKNGDSNLGNIYDDSFTDILKESEEIISNFNNNNCLLEICKHCSYKERFNKKY